MKLMLLVPAFLFCWFGTVAFFDTKLPDFFDKDPMYIFNKKARKALLGNKERLVMKIFGVISWLVSLVYILSAVFGWPIKV